MGSAESVDANHSGPKSCLEERKLVVACTDTTESVEVHDSPLVSLAEEVGPFPDLDIPNSVPWQTKHHGYLKKKKKTFNISIHLYKQETGLNFGDDGILPPCEGSTIMLVSVPSTFPGPASNISEWPDVVLLRWNECPPWVPAM